MPKKTVREEGENKILPRTRSTRRNGGTLEFLKGRTHARVHWLTESMEHDEMVSFNFLSLKTLL